MTEYLAYSAFPFVGGEFPVFICHEAEDSIWTRADDPRIMSKKPISTMDLNTTQVPPYTTILSKSTESEANSRWPQSIRACSCWPDDINAKMSELPASDGEDDLELTGFSGGGSLCASSSLQT